METSTSVRYGLAVDRSRTSALIQQTRMVGIQQRQMISGEALLFCPEGHISHRAHPCSQVACTGQHKWQKKSLAARTASNVDSLDP